MNKYVVGLIFTEDTEFVILQRKAKPPWQKGRFNGPGGKIEPGETPHMAMMREGQEELAFKPDFWESVVRLKGPDYEVEFFRVFVSWEVFSEIHSQEDEPLLKTSTDCLPRGVLGNLKIIIPIAANQLLCNLPVYLFERGCA